MTVEELATPESMAGHSAKMAVQADIELDSFLPLIQLLSGYQKDASNSHYIRGSISPEDSQLILQYVDTVGKFHIMLPKPNDGAIISSIYLSLIRHRPLGQAFFPNLEHLTITDAPHASLILPFFHSTPSIKSLCVKGSSKAFLSEELSHFLQQLIDEGVELSTLRLGPDKVALDVFFFLPQLSHIRHLELNECLSSLNMDDLKAIGSLPCLDILCIHATELRYPLTPNTGSRAKPVFPKKKKKGGQAKVQGIMNKASLDTPPDDGSDTQPVIINAYSLYFTALKKVDISGDLDLVKDLANLINSTSVTDISVVLKSHQDMRDSYSNTSPCTLCGLSTKLPGNERWAECSSWGPTTSTHLGCIKRTFLDILHRLFATQPMSRSVSLGLGGLYSIHFILTGADTITLLQLPSLRDLNIDHCKTDNLQWIQSMAEHKFDYSQLTTLHLPTQTTDSPAPWIRLTDLSWIPKLFPSLRSLRCLVDKIDQTTLCQIESLVSTGTADLHGLTTLSVGTPPKGSTIDYAGLLTVAEFVYFIFPNVDIVSHPGLDEAVWTFVGRAIVTFRRNRNHDSARGGDGAE